MKEYSFIMLATVVQMDEVNVVGNTDDVIGVQWAAQHIVVTAGVIGDLELTNFKTFFFSIPRA